MNQEICLKKCYLRYEPEIDGGTMFLFNKEDGTMLEGDYFSYMIIKELQKGNHLDEIKKSISLDLELSTDEIRDGIEYVLNYLKSERFLTS